MSLTNKELKKECDYLDNVLTIVNNKITKLKKDNQALASSITEEQKELWQNINEVDVSEIEFANLEIERNIMKAKMYYQTLTKFEHVYQSPYFGRIDFKEPDRETKVYIGLTSVSDDEYNNYVYDWRAPISSLYYDYEIGKAFYYAPQGIIKGIIDLKRQYKISNSKLEYAFDSSLNIQDEMLKEALSHNSSEKMKQIVTTIQKEQNQVIRNTEYDNLVVEGAAGSGKTSVALHRIAFILYRYRKVLKNNEIVIFSPNQVFSEYISDVLPSLGEQNVPCLLFSEFLEILIKEYEDVENYSLLIERYHNTKDELEKRILEIKMNNDFIFLIDRYIEREVLKIKFKDIVINGELIMSKEEVLNDFNNTYLKYKPFRRVEKIIENVSNKYRNTHLKKASGYKAKIKSTITYNDDILKLMINMYDDLEFLNDVKNKYKININDFKNFSLKEINSSQLKYYDAIIYLYLKAKLKGLNSQFHKKYVIIDEAQDYNLMQYYLIKEYYNQAKFTILGDPNQAITNMVNYDSMEKVKDIMGGKSKLLKLQTTYRSSYEITKFCNSILNLNNVNMINRHSDEVKIINTDKIKVVNILKQLIEDSFKSGFDSVAVLCENKEEALIIKELLKDLKTTKKLYILPVYSSKGLEFDSVIVYDENLSKNKKLYYVASTRALHRLNILKIKK